MGHSNRRRSVRVDCDLSVRIEAHDGQLDVRMADVSRTGVRLRIPGALLGVHRLSSLAQISRRLRDAAGDRFVADLHYEVLGPLLRKRLHPTRIGKRDWESTVVDVGCQLLEPLTDEEVGTLGLRLPPIGVEDVPQAPEAAAPRPNGPQRHPAPRGASAPPPERFVAWLYPEPGKSSPPLRTEALSLTRGMAILGVSPGQGWDLGASPVAGVVAQLDQAYGVGVMLRMVDGEDDLWAGPARLQEVDVTPSNDGIQLGVAFGRELRSEELGRLGLPTPA